MTTEDLRSGANNKAVWTGNTMRIKTEAFYCPDCEKYFAHPKIEDDRYTSCPYCGTDWIDHIWLNLDSRNFMCGDAIEDACCDMIDIAYELNYAKEDYAEQEIYTIDDWIDCATDMGGDWVEIDMDQVRSDLAHEKKNH